MVEHIHHWRTFGYIQFGTHTHEHECTREALVEVQGDALTKMQSKATKWYTWESTCANLVVFDHTGLG